MMTIVIGKESNLSQHLKSVIKDIILLSSRDIINELNKIKFSQNKEINVIFNNFQKATELNNIDSPKSYIDRSIMTTSIVLEYIKEHQLNVNKIIYTSSSSVYGNNILCKESDALMPLSLHSSLKIANEKLIEKFSIDNGIDYTIARIFNMYGGDDNFSIISKIKNHFLQNNTLTIVNNGNAIRDFIHIDDVVKVYTKLLMIKEIEKINIGSGRNTSIANIIDFLKNQGINIKTNNINRDELKVSSADITKLLFIMGDMNFQKVEDFLFHQIIEGQS